MTDNTNTKSVECYDCDGHGRVVMPVIVMEDNIEKIIDEFTEECDVCLGTGRLTPKRCEEFEKEIHRPGHLHKRALERHMRCLKETRAKLQCV